VGDGSCDWDKPRGSFGWLVTGCPLEKPENWCANKAAGNACRAAAKANFESSLAASVV